MELLQPQEVEVFYILPAIRKELSAVLKEKGRTQTEIARLLGVTPAAVSQYLNDKRGQTALPELREMITAAADSITDRQSMIKEVQRVLQEAKETKLICRIHEQHGKVPHGCDVCFPEDA